MIKTILQVYKKTNISKILNKLFSIVFKKSSTDLKIKNFQDVREFIFFFNTKEELLRNKMKT